MHFKKPEKMYKTTHIETLSKMQKVILSLLFCAFILIGLRIAGDYGVAWDDHLQTAIGKQNLEYALGQNTAIFHNVDRFYGSAFEVPLYFVQHFFSSYKSQVYVRHILTYFYFLVGLYFFFRLLMRFFNSFPLALLGMFLLYLNPRIFAHSFFNTKDIPFLTTFIISLYTLWRFLESPAKTKKLILHAFVSAFIIDIRSIGFLVPILSITMFMLVYIPSRKFNKMFKSLVKYILIMAVFVYALWPAMWTHPLLVMESLFRMAHFPWRYTNLIAGHLVLATQNPWYYIPLWIGITTPIVIIAFYLLGVFFIVWDFTKIKYLIKNSRWLFISFLSLFPLGLWLVFLIVKPTFYDGWRQLFFLAPLMILGAVYAVKRVFKFLINRKYALSLAILIVLFVTLLPAINIILLHPYQQTHFNLLVSKNKNVIRNNYEMDYWGLSYKEGFERLLKLDKSAHINVYVGNIAAIDNWKLTDEKFHRIHLVDKLKDADYLITNYRFHPKEFPYKKVISIERQGSCILGVYQLKK